MGVEQSHIGILQTNIYLTIDPLTVLR